MSTIGTDPIGITQHLYVNGDPVQEGSPGLTKREHFAAMALQGLLACPESPNPSGNQPWAKRLGKLAVEYADGLIAALNAEAAS